MIALVVIVLLGYVVSKAYYDFRSSGGLHGKHNVDEKGNPLLIVDQVRDSHDNEKVVHGAVINENDDGFTKH